MLTSHQIGSVALFGLYMVVTYVGKEWINWLLGWYFSIAGVGSVWKVRRSLFVFVCGWEHALVLPRVLTTCLV